eukprot:208344-Amphidinium_carterae.1
MDGATIPFEVHVSSILGKTNGGHPDIAFYFGMWNARGARGRLVMGNFFGNGQTTLLTETGKIIKGLKPTKPLDQKVYRLHHQWNKFPGPASLRSKNFAPFECLPYDVPHDGHWEENVDKYVREDPQLPLPPPHEDLDEVENEEKMRKSVRFAEELDDSIPVTDRRGTPNSNCKWSMLSVYQSTRSCLEHGV